jgi:putative phosphoribosyl transferase
VPFVDRDQAGHALGEWLGRMALVDPVVLALPRGGVPVGYQVAAVLGAPLDVIVVRKLGAPFQRELAMGAIGEGSVRVLDDDVLLACGLTDEEVDATEARERRELERRVRQYREGAPRIDLSGRTAVVVDDGMATGSTARAACSVARAQGAGYVVMAVPVASGHAVAQLEEVSDAVVVLEQPEPFYAVGQWYHRFDQTSDADVVALLAQARARTSHHTADRPPSEEERGGGPNAP